MKLPSPLLQERNITQAVFRSAIRVPLDHMNIHRNDKLLVNIPRGNAWSSVLLKPGFWRFTKLFVISDMDRNFSLSLTWAETFRYLWHGPKLFVISNMNQNFSLSLTWAKTFRYLWHGPKLFVISDMGQNFSLSLTWAETFHYLWHGPKLFVICDTGWNF